MVPPKRNPEEAPAPRRGFFFMEAGRGWHGMSPRIPWVKAFSRRTQGRIHVRLCAMSAKGWEKAMKGYIHNIERATRQNKTFRTVLYTAKNCQLVVMSLKPGEDIGAEVHKLDQFFRVEEGEGKAVLEGIEHRIKPGFAILVPAGTRHNIINGPSGPMKLYTLYAPPNHRDGVVHATKGEAEADKEHFAGKTTE